MDSRASAANSLHQPVNELVLVDDDKLTVEIVSWIVRKCNYRSKLFTSTDEAMAYLKLNTPALLIIDYYMPCMTGLEFITELHASTDLDQSAVFLCSAVPPPDGSSEKFAEMNVGILEKQLICDKSRLLHLLEAHLEPAGGTDT